MKKKLRAIYWLVLFGIFLLSAHTVHALDFDFQPRLDTGIMSYTFEVSPKGQSTLSGINQAAGYNNTREELQFSSTMGFVGGGATLFINRFFIDVSGLWAFDGSDHISRTESIYTESNEDLDNESTFISTAAVYDAQIDRSDHAVSVGYAVTRRLSVFAGYKWAAVDLDTPFSGPFSILVIDKGIINSQVAGVMDIEFDYEGPFVGVTHGWHIDGDALFQGSISFNAGLAYLSSDYHRHLSGKVTVQSVNGQDIEPYESELDPSIDTAEGNSWGLTLGLGWRGLTPLENLSYSLGISGHRYQFDSDDATLTDTSETAVSFKVGVAYLF